MIHHVGPFHDKTACRQYRLIENCSQVKPWRGVSSERYEIGWNLTDAISSRYSAAAVSATISNKCKTESIDIEHVISVVIYCLWEHIFQDSSHLTKLNWLFLLLQSMKVHGVSIKTCLFIFYYNFAVSWLIFIISVFFNTGNRYD